MDELAKQIENRKEEIENESVSDSKSLEDFRIKYLGTKGIVKTVMGEMKDVAPENKKAAGQLLNEFKLFVENKFESFKETISGGQTAKASTLDLSLPGDEVPIGSRHPVTLMRNRIISMVR